MERTEHAAAYLYVSLHSSLVTLSLSLEHMSSRAHSIAWYFFLIFWAGREFLFFFFHMLVRPFNTLGGRSARQRSKGERKLHKPGRRDAGRARGGVGGRRQAD
ncbi:hypothetical protein B0T18DRAFT_395970 [Schizothecium vesticola]|uniref:Uncharacterized protein n=1 Tax=Schizothecium vesticola TaxID=314040 RepID=A0AA40F8C3_9PEZI|nr:hypothetical protein B0T18DRAFT_395970 [Schizothecium vesticola]